MTVHDQQFIPNSLISLPAIGLALAIQSISTAVENGLCDRAAQVQRFGNSCLCRQKQCRPVGLELARDPVSDFEGLSLDTSWGRQSMDGLGSPVPVAKTR
jgi:hypothetical protein